MSTHEGWLQLSLQCDKAIVARAEDTLLDLGALSVTLQDQGDQPVLEPGVGETPLWDQVLLGALFPIDCDQQHIQRTLRTHYPDAALDLMPLADEDWSRKWLDQFQPICCGERLWICPSWTPPPNSNAVNLMLDPGLAFGTGTHPTTALCLQWLDGSELDGNVVVDYGCGSGILAIAALLLGAHHAICIDNDPQALAATRNNADNNNIAAEKMTVCSPEQAEQLFDKLIDNGAPIPIMMANILAAPLIDLAPALTRPLCENAEIILSGILDSQTDAVSAAYRSIVAFDAPVVRDGWALLHGRTLAMAAKPSGTR